MNAYKVLVRLSDGTKKIIIVLAWNVYQAEDVACQQNAGIRLAGVVEE